MTRYHNGGTVPLVPPGQWGAGSIKPGEHYDTDAVLGPPWVADVQATNPPADTPEAASMADNAPQAPSEPPAGEGPTLTELDNGDVVNEAGQVIGHVANRDHIEPAEQAANPAAEANEAADVQQGGQA